jgi:hypothetical protein
LLQRELALITEKIKPENKVRLHLLLISPKEPQKLEAWPDWLNRKGHIPRIKLDISLGDQPILDVSRCDEKGAEMVCTDYWRIGNQAKHPPPDPRQKGCIVREGGDRVSARPRRLCNPQSLADRAITASVPVWRKAPREV